MSGWSLRPIIVPDDFQRMAEIETANSPEPTTAADLAENEPRAKYELHCRLAAVDGNGWAGAYGVAWRWPEDPVGRIFLKVWVDPACRGQGLGTALADALESWAREHGCTEWTSSVRDNEPKALAFARQRGYDIDRHLFESTLDFATFDETPFAGAVQRAAAAGIRFLSAAEEPGPETERKLYELYARTVWEIPGVELQAYPPFAEWRDWVFGSSRSRPDLMLIAADGDQFVGCSVTIQLRSGNLYIDYTCTDREYRGRGIALALKLLSIRAARGLGAPYIRTNNDSQNGPMLAINRKLGFVPCPGRYRLKRLAGG